MEKIGVDAKKPQTEERIAFGVITNRLDVLQTTPITPSNEVLRKREAANRRQRECHARKKVAAVTPCSSTLMQPTTASLSMESEIVNAQLAETTKDDREERNRKQREYRQRKKVGSINPNGTVISLTPVQPSNEETINHQMKKETEIIVNTVRERRLSQTLLAERTLNHPPIMCHLMERHILLFCKQHTY